MDKLKWSNLKKRLFRLNIKKRISLLKSLLKKEKDKDIIKEIEAELLRLSSQLTIKAKPQVLITSRISPIEATAAERREIRPEMLKSLEGILSATSIPESKPLSLEQDQTKYAPSGKFYEKGSYKVFKYEDSIAKYEPPVDIKLMQALKPSIEYKSLADQSPMLEKIPETKKLEEGSHYKRKKSS